MANIRKWLASWCLVAAVKADVDVVSAFVLSAVDMALEVEEAKAVLEEAK